MATLRSSLPPELVSLIHHVELSKAGWWEWGIERMTLAIFWLLGGEPTLSEVSAAFRDQLGIKLSAATIDEHLKKLVGNGTLIPILPNRFKVSERALKELDAGLKAADANTAAARAKFESQVSEHCSELSASEAWTKFNDQLLIPLIRDIGARTYQLLSSAARDLEATPQFSAFLDSFEPTCRDRLQNAVINFLDPKDVAVRTYILSHLNAYFFVEAGNLPAATLAKVQGLAMKPPQFALFIDTNFLFSFLGFHENPSNEAAESLMRLVGELSGRVACKLYAYPLTLDEITRVFDWRANSFRGRPLTPAMAEAALNTGLTGVNKKLAEEVIRTKGRVTPEAFFQPYRTGLVQILRSKGIELFNVDVAKFSMRQDVIDDILDRQNFEEKKYKERAKTYEELRHDIILWHLVKERRPAALNLPLEAGSWVVTVDYKLLGFDAYKRHYSSTEIPVCVHPSALIQMFQFWVPRTPQFEEAVLGALRLPFLFHDFDPEAETTTLRILEGLVRFEDATDISAETATAILTNDALRAKLASTRGVNEGIELVKGALIEHAEQMKASLNQAAERARDLQGKVADKDRTISTLQADVEALRSEAAKDQKHAQERHDALGQQLKEVQQSLEGERSRLTAEVARHEDRAARARFVVLAAVPVVVLCGVLVGLQWWLHSLRVEVVAACLLLLAWVWSVDNLGKRRRGVSDWVWFDRFEYIRTAVYWVLLIIAGALIGQWAIVTFWPEQPPPKSSHGLWERAPHAADVTTRIPGRLRLQAPVHVERVLRPRP